MNERRAEEGIEHLQAAAHELIAAARVFLDAIEELVEEPDRVRDSIVGVVDLVKDAAGRRTQPWEAHAWWNPFTDAVHDPPAAEQAVDLRDHGPEPMDADSEKVGSMAERSESEADGPELDRQPPKPRSPGKRATAKRATAKRATVKRISVD